MYIYIFLIILIVCLYGYCNICVDRTSRLGFVRFTQTDACLLIVCLCIILINGLRSYSVGADTSQYLYILKGHAYPTDIKLVLEYSQFLFVLFNNFLSIFLSKRAYLLVLSIIFVITIEKVAVRETINPMLLLFFYVTIGTFSANMTAIRQSLAICLTTMAFYCAKKHKPLLFLVLVISAYLFHNSAIVFILTYPIVLFSSREIKRTRIILEALIPLLGLLPAFPIIVEKTVKIFNLTHFFMRLGQSGINLKCFIFYYGLLIITTFLYVLENDTMSSKDVILFRLGIITCICYAMAPGIFLLDRLALYFLPFLICYYTNSLCHLKKINTRAIATMSCILICTLWFIVSTINGSSHIDNYTFL